MNVQTGLGSTRDQRAFGLGGYATPLASHAGLAVLVVDDEAEVREEVTLALGRRGLSVLSAGSARMALSVLASRPDVGALVTDIRMPGMDGIAMAEAALAGRREADALEVLLVTGYASAAQGLAASRLGAFGVLQKPMRGADLARMVEEALARAAARRAAMAPLPPPGCDPMPDATFQADERAEDGWPGRAVELAVLDRPAAPLHLVRSSAAVGEAMLDEATPGAALAEDLADAVALEIGAALPRRAAQSAPALVGALAARLEACGARCSRRITLQPDADPAFDIDTARLVRAIGLLAHRALGGMAGTAELSLDAGAGQARLDLLLRPDWLDAVEPEPSPERSLPITVARRLVGALGGRLDAWTIPTGGLRARLLIRAG